MCKLSLYIGLALAGLVAAGGMAADNPSANSVPASALAATPAIVAGRPFVLPVPDGEWRRVDPGGAGGTLGYGVHPVTGTILMCSDMSFSVLRSTDSGRSFQPACAQSICHVQPHPLKAGVWYGVERHGLLISHDDGDSWEKLFTTKDVWTQEAFLSVLPDKAETILLFDRRLMLLSRDGGHTFAPWSDGLSAYDAKAVARDPYLKYRVTSRSQPFIAHFEEAGRMNILLSWPDGIYQRALEDKEWRKLAVPGLENATPSAVAVDRQKGWLWAAFVNPSGLARRPLGGKWEVVNNEQPGIVILRTHPQRPGVLWTFNKGAPGGVFRSDDGGKTFKWLSRFLAGGNEQIQGNLPLPSQFDRWFINNYQFDLMPDNPDRLVLSEGWISSDGGETWEAPGFQYLPDRHAYRGNGDALLTDYCAWFDNFQPNKVYLGYSDAGLAFSEDRGYSVRLREMSQGSTYNLIDEEYNRRFKVDSCHNCMALALDPEQKGLLYYAKSGRGDVPDWSGGMILKSYDDGRHFIPLWPEESGLPLAIINKLLIFPHRGVEERKLFALINTTKRMENGPEVTVSQKDSLGVIRDSIREARRQSVPDGGLYQSLDSGRSWRRIGGRDVFAHGFPLMDVQYCRDQPQVMYLCSTMCQGKRPGLIFIERLSVKEFATPGGVYKSTDGGVTWAFLGNQNEELTNCQQLAVHPEDPQRLLAATVKSVSLRIRSDGANSCGGIYKSTDGGKTWKLTLNAADFVPAGEFWNFYGYGATSVAINPELPSLVYAAVNGAGVFRSLDEGETWQRVDWEHLQKYQTTYHTLAVNPHDPAEFYLALFGNAFLAYRDPVAAAELDKRRPEREQNLLLNPGFEQLDEESQPCHWQVHNFILPSGKSVLSTAASPDKPGKSLLSEVDQTVRQVPTDDRPDTYVYTYLSPYAMNLARGQKIRAAVNMHYDSGPIEIWPLIEVYEYRDGFSRKVGEMRGYWAYGEKGNQFKNEPTAEQRKTWVTLDTYAPISSDAEAVKILIWTSHKRSPARWFFDDAQVSIHPAASAP